MSYAIYGKRIGADKNFAALDKNGCRVTTKAKAQAYNTKEEAQAVIDARGAREPQFYKSKNKTFPPGKYEIVYEIRKL